MKNVAIKSSFLLILFLFSCKENKEKLLNRKPNAAESATILNYDNLIIRNDSIILNKNQYNSTDKIYFKSLINQKYILPVTECISEDSSWRWSIAYSGYNNIEREKALSNFRKRYKNFDFDFDFDLYQGRNDEFFFKIKSNKLYLVAYKYSMSDLPTPIVKIKNRVHTEIGEKETIKEKIILLNILVTKTFDTNFICEYRNNHKKYPFKVIKTINYNNSN